MDSNDRNLIFNPKKEGKAIIGNEKSHIFVCGKNDKGELGISSVYSLINIPSGLNNSKKILPKFISSGANHSGLINKNDELYLCGSTLHNKLGIVSKLKECISVFTLFPESKYSKVEGISCGDYHTLCLFENGKVWGWGGTLYKKLGTNTSIPSLLNGFDKIKITKISCGDFHSAALSNNGVIFTWGGGGKYYNKGQCGHGELKDYIDPLPISFFKDDYITDFDCGGFHTICKNSKGEFFSWGSGYHGECGHKDFNNFLLPKKIELNIEVTEDKLKEAKITCGGQHSFLLIDGKVFGFGKVSHGQLGIKSKKNIGEPFYISYLNKINIKSIKAGWNHSSILTNEGDIFTTGYNKYGQLGLGDYTNRYKFEHVKELAGRKCTEIYLGGHHSFFIITNNIENYNFPSEFEDFSFELNQTNIQSVDKSKSMIKRKIDINDNISYNSFINQIEENKFNIEVIYTDNKNSHRFISIEMLKENKKKFKEDFNDYLLNLEEIDKKIIFYKIHSNKELLEETGSSSKILNNFHESHISYTIMIINDLSENLKISNLYNDEFIWDFDEIDNNIQIYDTDIGKKIKYTSDQIINKTKLKKLGLWHLDFEEKFKDIAIKMNFVELRPDKYK